VETFVPVISSNENSNASITVSDGQRGTGTTPPCKSADVYSPFQEPIQDTIVPVVTFQGPITEMVVPVVNHNENSNASTIISKELHDTDTSPPCKCN